MITSIGKLRVVQLTQETLKIQCKIDDYEEWGAPMLDLQQYQRKEELQRATSFSRRGSIFWALVEDSKDSNDFNHVVEQPVLYCHCESHRFDCVVRRSSGDIEQGYSHHIGSVFTLPEYRNRGLAKIFMQEVARQLKKLPRALVSILYSDIGPNFYDKLGWKLHPSKMAILNVVSSRSISIENKSGEEIVPLNLDTNLEKLLQHDNERLISELASEKYECQEAFVVLPTRDSIEWQFCIGEYFAQIRGYKDTPTRCGVKINKNAFILWCHNLKESTLYVVRSRFPEACEQSTTITCQLLNEALSEANKFNLEKIAIWVPAKCLHDPGVQRYFEINFVDRESSLSSAIIFHHDSESNSPPKSLLQVTAEKNKTSLQQAVEEIKKRDSQLSCGAHHSKPAANHLALLQSNQEDALSFSTLHASNRN
ncbi:hypothetical protein PsorP6_002537 [Peronosclerospora sorghi]|uniref:Uncharacterized protein n=1 Tax=Peronosclerospora sorghi TaxID=230839 RepID=A0ACC0WU10_9STRA|nr:hypothetical protein PsorP6_002537 [Peronosclerospora sorghi]